MDNSVRKVAHGIQIIVALLLGGHVARETPGMIRSYRAVADNARVLEKYAPGIKDGTPLTVEQGEDLIYREYDGDQNRRISTAERDAVISRAQSMMHYSFPGWERSGQNILEARRRIDETQKKED